MQIQERNRIGNQSFLLLLYLLLIDAGLSGFGIKWVAYPANIMIILCGCATIHTVRLIRNNAYVGPSTKSANVSRNTMAIAVGAVLIAVLLSYILVKTGGVQLPGDGEGSAAVILFLISVIALAMLGITGAIRKRQDRDDDENDR